MVDSSSDPLIRARIRSFNLSNYGAKTVETKTDTVITQVAPSTQTVVSASSLGVVSYVVHTQDHTYLVQLNSGAASTIDQLKFSLENEASASAPTLVSVYNISSNGQLTSVPHQMTLQDGNLMLTFNTVSQGSVSRY